MRFPRVLAFFLVPFLLAGCTNNSTPATEPEESVTVPSPSTDSVQLRVVRLPIWSSLSVGNRSGPVPFTGHQSLNGTDPQTGVTVEVLDNATALVLEARIACATAPCNFWLGGYDPAGRLQAEAPPSEAALRVVYEPGGGVQAGGWFVRVYAEGAEAQMMGELRASIFYNGIVPAGYSAF